MSWLRPVSRWFINERGFEPQRRQRRQRNERRVCLAVNRFLLSLDRLRQLNSAAAVNLVVSIRDQSISSHARQAELVILTQDRRKVSYANQFTILCWRAGRQR